MEDVKKLSELQSYRFAAHDMLLYLDTHPDDKKAFGLYKELVNKYMALTKSYEAENGPLTAFAEANSNSFNWLDSPWPWEKEANDNV